MKNHNTILLLIVIFTVVLGFSRKVEILYVMNGGHIMSTWEDWITLKITSTNLNDTINCADGRGYTFKPGTILRFSNLWFPEGDIIGITLVQYNFFSKDDAITLVDDGFLKKRSGYYHQYVTLSQFRRGGSITFGFQWIDITFAFDSYNQTADYIEVLRIHDQLVMTNSSGLQDKCRL